MSFFVFLGDDYRRLPLFPLRDVSTEHSPTVHCCTPHKRCRSGHCICICFCVCICICNYIRILYLTYLDVNAPQAGMGLSLIMSSPILSLPCLVVAGLLVSNSYICICICVCNCNCICMYILLPGLTYGLGVGPVPFVTMSALFPQVGSSYYLRHETSRHLLTDQKQIDQLIL